ncbi:MAG: hypothetical protein ABIJ96_16950 [Elusimicrobiota bacterium]
MPMLDIMEMDRLYGKKWVVLDRSLKVVDHSPDLTALRGRYEGRGNYYTYFFAPGSFAVSLC